MPYTLDPNIDDEELRRRSALDPSSYDEEDYAQLGVQNPNETTPAESGVAPTKTPVLSPAQVAYSKALGNVPIKANYPASRLTRVAAALSGFGAGLRGSNGFAAAQQVKDDKFNEALQAWQRSAEAAGGQAGIEEKAIAQDIASRRALAYGQSAEARQRQAAADEAWRHAQEVAALKKPIPWVPTTKQDYMDVHPARQTAETEIQFAQRDPEGYAAYRKARQNNNQITFDQWKQRADYQNKLNMARDQARPRNTPKGPSPRDQAYAESIATSQLLRAHPEHEQFVNRTTNNKGQEVITIKHPDQLQNTPKARADYAQFLSDLDKQKKRILGKSSWQIEPADDEPDEDEDDQEEEQ